LCIYLHYYRLPIPIFAFLLHALWSFCINEEKKTVEIDNRKNKKKTHIHTHTEIIKQILHIPTIAR
jgi:energy-converting hydrogenase Eha subunit H